MKKVLTIVGARPQFIKAAMLSRCFNNSTSIEEVIVHTGQHFDHGMSNVFFSELSIPTPKYSLGISGGGHGEMTGRMLCALEPVIKAEKPDLVLVYGDTNSTIAGAMVASKLHVPIAHVEAGLRSYNRRMPEEINPVLTDQLSDLLLCPTKTAVKNLAAEGILNNVSLVGDIMYDAALYFGRIAQENSHSEIFQNLLGTNFILATIHRQENTDDKIKLEKIVRALAKISESTPVLFPMHPRTKASLEMFGLSYLLSGPLLHVVEPFGYLDMLYAEQSTDLIVTDSGGVQKEAFFFGVPCVTLRDQTEWVELVDSGWNLLVDVLSDNIVELTLNMIGRKGQGDISPYGEGDTAEIIFASINKLLGL